MLSLTIEYSMPVSSPAAPSRTSPRALRSRVLQASSTSEYFKCFWNPPFEFEDVHRVLRVLRVFRVLSWLQRGYEVLKPRIFPSYMLRDVLALHMELPPSLRLNRRIRLRVKMVFWIFQISHLKFIILEKICHFCKAYPVAPEP